MYASVFHPTTFLAIPMESQYRMVCVLILFETCTGQQWALGKQGNPTAGDTVFCFILTEIE